MKAQNTSDFGHLLIGLIIVVLVLAIVSEAIPSMMNTTAEAARNGGKAACTSLFQEACK